VVEFGDSISAESPAGMSPLGDVANRFTVTALRLVDCVLVDVFNSASRTAAAVVVLVPCTSLAVVLAPVITDSAIQAVRLLSLRTKRTTNHSGQSA